MSSYVTTHLMLEKRIQRMLKLTEERVEEQKIEDWQLNQFVNTLTNVLNDLRKSINRPSNKQLDEYKQRIDRLRQKIDPVKLDDQTFPRQKLLNQPTIESVVKKQSNEVAEQNVETSNKENKPTRVPQNRSQEQTKSEEDKQDDIARDMLKTTRNIKENALKISSIVQDDQKTLVKATQQVDHNMAKLQAQSKRLRHNAYNGSNCWIYLMLIVVMITFIYLTLFMRMFRKRVTISTTIKHSNHEMKSSFLDNSINQTSINNTNLSTTTKSTDYISLLLNYANENHTDL